MTLPHPDTRQRLIETARRLFAERGYHGVSITAVAAELGLTKQALLYHFGSKKTLYGAVLQDITGHFLQVVNETADIRQPPTARLRAVMLALHSQMMTRQDDARIIMRELLDNEPRAAQSRTWYLRPFLERLVALTHQLPGWQRLSEAQAFARTYQVVGAINYFAVSGPTLTQILGQEALSDVQEAYEGELQEMLRAFERP